MKKGNYDVVVSDIKETDFSDFLDIINNTSKSYRVYRRLFKNHKSFIYGIIHKHHPSLISNIEINSEEIFNTSIVKVQKKFFSKEYQYDGRATFRTYIFTVYKYTAMEVAKELQKRKFELFDDENFGIELLPVNKPTRTYFDSFLEIIQKIENSVHRAVLQRIFLDRNATSSIADEFGITASNVRQIKRRNLPFIQKEMRTYTFR